MNVLALLAAGAAWFTGISFAATDDDSIIPNTLIADAGDSGLSGVLTFES